MRVCERRWLAVIAKFQEGASVIKLEVKLYALAFFYFGDAPSCR